MNIIKWTPKAFGCLSLRPKNSISVQPVANWEWRQRWPAPDWRNWKKRWGQICCVVRRAKSPCRWRGPSFCPYAREILAQENAAHAALGRGNVTATGTLRFTAPSTFAQLYIAPILPEFLALHPGISLDLRLTDMEFDLIQGSFDLALRNSALDG